MNAQDITASNPWDLTEGINEEIKKKKGRRILAMAITTRFDGRDNDYHAIVIWD